MYFKDVLNCSLSTPYFKRHCVSPILIHLLSAMFWLVAVGSLKQGAAVAYSYNVYTKFGKIRSDGLEIWSGHARVKHTHTDSNVVQSDCCISFRKNVRLQNVHFRTRMISISYKLHKRVRLIRAKDRPMSVCLPNRLHNVSARYLWQWYSTWGTRRHVRGK